MMCDGGKRKAKAPKRGVSAIGRWRLYLYSHMPCGPLDLAQAGRLIKAPC
jgi:hypothetical protein